MIRGKKWITHESCLRKRIEDKILHPLKETFPHFQPPAQVPSVANFKKLKKFLDGLVFKLPFNPLSQSHNLVLEDIFFEMEQIYFFFGEDVVASKISLEQMVIGGRGGH